jgi:hypothetical protein
LRLGFPFVVDGLLCGSLCVFGLFALLSSVLLSVFVVGVVVGVDVAVVDLF